MVAFAERHASGAGDAIEKARRLFVAVRDGIAYSPYVDFDDPASYRASGVLEAGRGFCVPKAALLAAAARAVGLESRVAFADVRNHLATPGLLELMGTDVFLWHGCTELLLDSRWVKVTPAFDRGLCERFGVAPLEFDGRHDALLQEFDGGGRRYLEYVRDRGSFEDVPFETMRDEYRAHYPRMFLEARRWDRRYSASEYVRGTEPTAFLKDNAKLLPPGRALDLAAGEGRNAVFLAQLGLEVDAVDFSPVGLGKAEALATERGVAIRTIAADLAQYDVGTNEYDVVTNFYFMQRDLTPRIKRALRPGGVVIYETFTVEHLEVPGTHGPRTREFLLERGELETMFRDFEILHTSETRTDRKAVASLIAQKPR